jgi:hypothetical protein
MTVGVGGAIDSDHAEKKKLLRVLEAHGQTLAQCKWRAQGKAGQGKESLRGRFRFRHCEVLVRTGGRACVRRVVLVQQGRRRRQTAPRRRHARWREVDRNCGACLRFLGIANELNWRVVLQSLGRQTTNGNRAEGGSAKGSQGRGEQAQRASEKGKKAELSWREAGARVLA